MDNIKISVIIPVYNVEPYLRECLDSVINQTLKEIEIICIDDCSTDNSYQILEEYAKKDNRIIVLQNEKNVGGPSFGRNKGIKKSKGEYISFIDSDDYLSKNYFYDLYNTAKKYNSDISYTSNIWKSVEGKESYHDNLNLYNFITEKEKKELKYSIDGKSDINLVNVKDMNKEHFWVSSCNKIYRRSFIINNNLFFFGEKSYSEDVDFIYRILFYKPTTSYNHNSIYYYRQRKLSSVDISTRDTNTIIVAINLLNNSIDLYKNNNSDMLNYIYLRVFQSIHYRFENFVNKEIIYKYVHDFTNTIFLLKEISPKFFYIDYLLIKNNDTYEKYLLQKKLFECINNIENKINQLDDKINRIQNNKIKLFGIKKFNDKTIIYIFGIKITIKK
ncbi:glycosyltransferase [Brachyspira sp. SAP_772]|uniref:glycosyltransferase n=1 Tax=Brachyspira sp. SAP_772 TaxID=2608385 RepID=UPI0012F48B71|nr:glycosyltransferase [Brachyspira sp. SAP_772]